jgi:hypothetical protein
MINRWQTLGGWPPPLAVTGGDDTDGAAESDE